MITKEDKINLVLLAYQPINRNIVADGVVGREAMAGIYMRRGTKDNPLFADQTNRIILALKFAGFNDALVADGVVGPALFQAEDAFLAAHFK